MPNDRSITFGPLSFSLEDNDDAFLLDLTTGDRVNFKYMPTMFTESKTANYQNTPILGRSEPVLGYAGSGPRIFNIPLTFAATNNPWTDVIQPVRTARSWVYPDYSQADTPKVPPTLVLQVGAWLSSRCVCTRVDIRYHGPWGKAPTSSQEFPVLSAAASFFGIELQANVNPAVILDMVPPGFNVPLSYLLSDSMYPFWAQVDVSLQETNLNVRGGPPGSREVRAGNDRFLDKSEGGLLVDGDPAINANLNDVLLG